jgi:hypothetical protein
MLAIAVVKGRIHPSPGVGFASHLDLSVLKVLFKVPDKEARQVVLVVDEEDLETVGGDAGFNLSEEPLV